LIRYRVGDRGAIYAGEDRCMCGRTLPVLASVEGRIDDVVLTRDGRPVGRLDPVFKQDLAVRAAQIIQESLEKICVRYVPAPGFGPKDAKSISDGLRARLGDVEVVLEAVEKIPCGPNGKFRAVISEIRERGQH